MNWTQLSFGKHEGKTLPQVMFEDPDWFFYGCERVFFKNGQAHEAREIYRRSRSVRIPQRNGQRMFVQYIIHQPNRKFETMQLIPDGSHLKGLNVSRLIDWYIPRLLTSYDKGGYKNFVFALKAIIFNDHTRYMTKQVCEEFFNDDNCFDLAYAMKIYPSRYDGLLVF